MKKSSKNFPDRPGIYLFKKGRKILYIGKAASLRDRVRSYFSKDLIETRGPGIAKMVGGATGIQFRVSGSVLEALILEAELIKKYKPKYNVKEKDDKSFNFVVITKENFPRVLVLRGQALRQPQNFAASPSLRGLRRGRNFGVDFAYIFGPFPRGGELREAMKIIRRIFPFRDKCNPENEKPCFNRQIGLCPGVCTGEITQKEYLKTIRNLKLLFSGHLKKILNNLKKQMAKAANEEHFEEAARLRNQIFALEHINDVALLKRKINKVEIRIEAFDVAHISGKWSVGAMIVLEVGETAKKEYKRFRLRGMAAQKPDDLANLREILERRFGHPEWGLPDLVVVDGGDTQRKVGERVLRTYGYLIPVVSVVKDDRHRPREILGDSKIIKDHRQEILLANSEAHRFAIGYHRKLRSRVV